jgi:hypothetical protein
MHRWEDNTKMGLQGIGWEGMDWIVLAHDRYQQQAVVNMVANL